MSLRIKQFTVERDKGPTLPLANGVLKNSIRVEINSLEKHLLVLLRKILREASQGDFLNDARVFGKLVASPTEVLLVKRVELAKSQGFNSGGPISSDAERDFC